MLYYCQVRWRMVTTNSASLSMIQTAKAHLDVSRWMARIIPPLAQYPCAISKAPSSSLDWNWRGARPVDLGNVGNRADGSRTNPENLIFSKSSGAQDRFCRRVRNWDAGHYPDCRCSRADRGISPGCSSGGRRYDYDRYTLGFCRP